MVSQFLYRRIRTNGNTCGSTLLYHLTPVQRAVDKHGRDKNNHQTRLRNAGGIAWISIPIHSSKGHGNRDRRQASATVSADGIIAAAWPEHGRLCAALVDL